MKRRYEGGGGLPDAPSEFRRHAPAGTVPKMHAGRVVYVPEPKTRPWEPRGSLRNVQSVGKSKSGAPMYSAIRASDGKPVTVTIPPRDDERAADWHGINKHPAPKGGPAAARATGNAQTGPRGGRYIIGPNGKKYYVKK